MVSKALKIAVLLNEKKAYQIAQEAGLHPSTLSKLLHGIEKVKPGDERVLRVAKVLNLDPRECFTEETGGPYP
jgi:transcriptional regulator with XRE-family HTH domain